MASASGLTKIVKNTMNAKLKSDVYSTILVLRNLFEAGGRSIHITTLYRLLEEIYDTCDWQVADHGIKFLLNIKGNVCLDDGVIKILYANRVVKAGKLVGYSLALKYKNHTYIHELSK